MSVLNQIQDQLEAVRNHRGTVRISIGNNSVNADVLGTKIYASTDPHVVDYLHGSFRILADSAELIQMQHHALQEVFLPDDTIHCYVYSPNRQQWVIEDAVDLIINERGQYLWTVHLKFYEEL